MELLINNHINNILKKYPDNLSTLQIESVHNIFSEIIEFNPELLSNILDLLSNDGIFIFLSQYFSKTNNIENSLYKAKIFVESLNTDISKFIYDFSKLYKRKVYWNCRIKSLSSIIIKLFTKKLTINNVNDLIGVRFIMRTERECDLLFQHLQNYNFNYRIQIYEVQNYIKTPKNNNYKSFHAIILTSTNMKFEIQIRTNDMHERAESGEASHFSYKMIQYLEFFEIFKQKNLYK